MKRWGYEERDRDRGKVVARNVNVTEGKKVRGARLACRSFSVGRDEENGGTRNETVTGEK